MAKQRKQKNRPASGNPLSKSEEIPGDEQWRIIEQSGVLKNIPLNKSPSAGLPSASTLDKAEVADDEDFFSPLCNEIFNTVLLAIPFSSLYIMMDVLTHRQYAQMITTWSIIENALWGVPLLFLFIFYTTRHKAERRMQALLFFLSVGCGSRLIYVVNWASWKTVMKQCPPLGTIWIYTVAQLDLLPAVVALASVAGFVKWKDLKIIF
ncbi:hypothetical protein M0805_007275 [Coniferiporia weirii]|nr:hypothetical protein M0805_007275 [Coniferiporia weirii]